MKFYKVLKKTNAANEDCVLVPTGFCWWNLLFGVLWAAYKRVWDLVIIDLLLIAIFSALMKFYPFYVVEIIVMSFAVQVLLSFYVTNCFLKWKLIKLGYKEVDLIASSGEAEALLRFLSVSKRT